MMDKTRLLDNALEALRQERAFMLTTLARSTVSSYLGLGRHVGNQWQRYIGRNVVGRSKPRYEMLSEDEVIKTADMRKLLHLRFWTLQGRSPKDKFSMTEIGDDGFWLEFLRLAREVDWRPKEVQQAVLASVSGDIPRSVNVAAWLYLFTNCRDGRRGDVLPAAAFERLEHVEFSPEQQARWENLAGFGQEALFKKQIYRTNMAMDMMAASIKDWFTYALYKCRGDFVCHCLKKCSESELGLSRRDVLLYVVANWHGHYVVDVVRCLEELSPGLCASFRDKNGCNLFWYTSGCWQLRSAYASKGSGRGRHGGEPKSAETEQAWQQLAKVHGDPNGRNSSNRKLIALLIEWGVSPHECNVFGMSFNDLDEFARMAGLRWQITRVQKQVPGFADRTYWR